MFGVVVRLGHTMTRWATCASPHCRHAMSFVASRGLSVQDPLA
jgi:hypothetical protein